MLYPRESANREVKNLDGFWTFCPDKNDIGEKEGFCGGNFSGDVREAAVPASYNEQFDDLFNFHGKVWYGKEFFVPASFEGKAVYIRFGSVAGKAKVYLNGEFLGEHVGTALPFEFEISKYARFGQKNKIVVLADSSLDPWSLPPAAMSKTEGSVGFFGSYPAVTYDFFPYGGIARSVYLYTCAKEHIKDVTVKTEIGKTATVKFEVEFSKSVRGTLTVQTDGKAVSLPANGESVCGEIKVENPRLWDIGKPELYDLELVFESQSGEKDAYTESYGIREVKVEGDKFLLNGKSVFFKGFGKHEDFAVLGKGFSHAVTVKDFELLKWIGANSFRTSHYPYDERILEYADRNGILVIDETPFVGLSQRLYKEDILDKAKSVINELIKRDKNHPCVVMWSLANEPYADSLEAKHFFKEMAETAKKLDSTRPITYVAHMEPEDNAGYEFYDVVCINKYYGWYIAPGQVEESLPHFADCIERFREAFKKPMIISEFGADAIDGMHTNPAQMFTEEYQAKTIKLQYEEMCKKDYIIGAHVWAFADFKAAQSTSRIILNRKGVFTRDRNPKMAAHMLREMWKEK